MMDKCNICGGDKDVGRLAEMMGYRPDVAWAEARKQTRLREELESDLRKLVERMDRFIIPDKHNGGECLCDYCTATRKWRYEVKKLLNREGE